MTLTIELKLVRAEGSRRGAGRTNLASVAPGLPAPFAIADHSCGSRDETNILALQCQRVETGAAAAEPVVPQTTAVATSSLSSFFDFENDHASFPQISKDFATSWVGADFNHRASVDIRI